MTKFPDFAKLPFDAELPAQSLPAGEPWRTPEGIAVRSAYGPADTAGRRIRVRFAPGCQQRCSLRGEWAVQHTRV